MNTGNTTFYHKHIQSSINKLDERKDKFIGHRLDFLREYCEPIQEKIDLIQKEIERYKVMRDTQEEVIENDPEIVSIKEELKNYEHTHRYYEEKLNEYEKKSIELEQYNGELAKRITFLKRGIKSHREELGFRLPNINRVRMNTSSY
jgi:chromosome segregation ATPase